ncbi:MAG: hypothetical protein KA330_08740 [Chitinophagaceae bacterium]|jgi:hypothetical protein|nr:hypothetical protein [Chitinophagaceae bacterium]MBP6416532.1 hypothetical protein [Chitinophagaceae bacterium]
MPVLAVAFLIRYWLLLQEVLDVRVIALLQLSLDGCAKLTDEKNKLSKENSKIFFRSNKAG